MDSLVNSLIQDGKIRYQSGNFFTFGFPNNMLTLTTATVFFNILGVKYGNGAKEIIKSIGKIQAKAMMKAWFEKFEVSNHSLSIISSYLEIYCYGSIRIASVNQKQKEVVFEVKNSPVCRMHLKLFGYENSRVNYFMEGICSGIAEAIIGCNMDSEETSCILSHKQVCCIVARKSSSKKKDFVIGKGYDLFSEKFRPKSLPEISSELVKKVEGHNMIEWDNGMFTIWKVGAFTMPSATFALIINELRKKFGSEVDYIMYHLARVQSREAVNLQIRTYGFKKDKNLMMSLLEHMQLTGYGIGTPIELDIKKKKAKVKGTYNPIPFFYSRFFGNDDENADYYILGLIAGMCECFFEDSVNAVETKCSLKNGECCIYEVKRAGKEDFYKIDKKTMKIIEEKINPKNFVI
ncbi:MAG TPA: hypothetical protein VI564_09405 [Candidatus Nanoarchaeia archaeon]|nr:hypothetical protein [Candidatus Nanoarchaeia archaeon]